MTLDEWIKVAPLISAGAIVISSTVALIVLIYTRRVNRRRATLDMVMRTFLDERGTKVYDDFKNIIRRDKDPQDPFSLVSLVTYTKEIEPIRNVVIDQLNSYELVALGIRRKVFDEAFYHKWFHGQFTRDFENVRSLIDAVQQQDRPSVFCEFKGLYERWNRKGHPANNPNVLMRVWWAIRADPRLSIVSRLKDRERAASNRTSGG